MGWKGWMSFQFRYASFGKFMNACYAAYEAADFSPANSGSRKTGSGLQVHRSSRQPSFHRPRTMFQMRWAISNDSCTHETQCQRSFESA